MMIKKISWPWRIAAVMFGIMLMWLIYLMVRPYDEVALTIGASYEKARSGNTLQPAEVGHFWFGFVTRPAVLRFVDSQYGFITPAAKFLTVSYDDHGTVESTRMSPQVKILPLDESLVILFDLQNQLIKGGWQPFRVDVDPPFEDNKKTRTKIENCANPVSYWQAGDKYQATLDIRCFWKQSQPENIKRYLITLQVAPPFIDRD